MQSDTLNVSDNVLLRITFNKDLFNYEKETIPFFGKGSNDVATCHVRHYWCEGGRGDAFG